MEQKKCRVVIIGGGFCGAYVAKALDCDFDVTLIDEKDYFEFTPGILRAIVEPDHVRNIQVLHSHYTRDAQIVRGSAESITKNQVVVDGRRIPYDYLVLTTGFRYGLPFKPEDVVISSRASALRNNKRRLERAKTVLIIGGGLSGVELSGEIAERYPHKEVIIVHNKSSLIPRNSERCKNYVTKHLARRGVTVHTGEEVTKIMQGVYTTNTDRSIKADIAFLCTGIKPNIEYLKRSFPDLVTVRNQIVVNKCLQVKGFPTVFAGGDITDVKEEKTAQNAEKHAQVIVENIRRMQQGRQFIVYKSRRRPMLISLGKKDGVLEYKRFALGGRIPAFLKWFIEWRTMQRYRRRR